MLSKTSFQFFHTKSFLRCAASLNNSHFGQIDFDVYLKKALDHLQNRWFDPKVGLVGCALIDTRGVIYDTTRLINGLWSHAEYNAYHQYLKKFGVKPTPNASMVVTLSPCIKPLLFSRQKSCSELLREGEISTVHIGKLDLFHAKSLEVYRAAGMNITLTQDENLLVICDRIFNIIRENGDISPQDLTVIKKTIGDDIFIPTLEQRCRSKVC